jgi:hypothetical protein
MASDRTSMAAHPDLAEMRARYDRLAETPVAQTTDGLTVLAGLYLALSPWIVGFSDTPALAVNNLVIGLAVVALAIGFASAYSRTHGITWLCPLLGVWTIISQWVMAEAVATTGIVLSNVIVGAVIVVLGVGGVAMPLQRR